MTSTSGRTLGGKSLDRNLEAIIIFASIALGLSVVYWLIFYLSQKGAIRFAPDRSTWGAARAYGPTAAAVISALYVGGLSSLKRLWMRVTAWKVPWWLYALALLGFPVAVLGDTYATAVFGTAPVTVGRTSPLHLLLLFFYICNRWPPGRRDWMAGLLAARTPHKNERRTGEPDSWPHWVALASPSVSG